MNFNFYVLGTPDGKYSQYPNDYTSSSFLDHTKYLKGARLIIFREMNLFHYVFVEKLHGENMIGFCLVMNNATVYDIHNLIALFRKMVEERMVYSGKILQYSNDGGLKYNITSFSSCITELDDLREFIEDELGKNPDKYGIKEATSIYNGTKTIGRSSMSLSNDEILEQTKKHNTLILDDGTGIEGSYIDKLISDFLKKNNELKYQVVSLQRNIKDLENQKKRLSTVLWLTLVIIIGGILAVLIVNIKNEQIDEITLQHQKYQTEKEEEISILTGKIEEISSEYQSFRSNKETEIRSLKTSLDSTNVSLKNKISEIVSLQEHLTEKEKQVRTAENFRNKISSSFPIIINSIEISNESESAVETDFGKLIYASRSMYLTPRMTYTALTSGSKTLYVKLYKPNGTMSTGTSSPSGYTYSNTISLSKGESGTYKFSGWGGKDRGHWPSGSYRFEIWYDNTCLKAKTFTIY